MKFLILILLPTQAMATTLIYLKVGETRQLPIQKSETVWLKNSRTLEVNDLGPKIHIRGKRVGSVLMSIGSKRFHIYVLSDEDHQNFFHLKNTLSHMRGLSLNFKEKTILISGELLRLSDWIQISEATSKVKNFSFRAQIPIELQESIKNFFQKKLNRHSLPPVKLSFSQQPIAYITQGKKDRLSRYRNIFQPFGILVKKDPELLSIAPMIRVKIIMAEVKRRGFVQFGLQWPESYTTKIFGSGSASDNTSAEFSLHSLEAQGLGKVLATPVLLCKSGEEAQFLAGGEFPIKILSHQKRNVVWKKHGIILHIKPTADHTGRMSIEILTEISLVDHANKIDGIPSLLTNRIQSHFDLYKSNTIALSGLIKKEWGNSHQGVPFFSRIPVLGHLFSSKDYQENKTELVVFVTPEVVKEPRKQQEPHYPKEWKDEL